MVKSIFLQDGEEIFVDDEDYERVSQYTWCKSYAGNYRRVSTLIGRKSISLQTFIEEGSFQQIKNNDFTRKNLTIKGNGVRWAKARPNNSSKYKGVNWDKKRNKWRAQIRLNGDVKFLGRYLNEDDAARAYNQAVFDYWDGNGFINVIGKDNRGSIRTYETFNGQTKRRAGKSKLKGVGIWGGKIFSRIIYKRQHFILGTFPTTYHAALTYNKCAIYLHGDDAILNDVPMTDELKEFIENWEIPKKILDLKK